MTLGLILFGAALTAQPLVSPDVLEPSVLNEVEHALSRVPESVTFSDAAFDKSLTASAAAIALISRQTSDGRWLDGSNDVTFASALQLARLGGRPQPMKLFSEVRGIPYVTEGDAYRRARCWLNVRVPKAAQGFKTVVWFHGGGLTSGSAHYIPLTDPSIAQVAVSYRLMNATNGLAGADCIRDAAAAVAWTLKHIADFGGDSRKVYVSGMSAGGYLTMMVGMAPQYLAAHGFKPTDLAGLAPVSGQATTHFNVRAFAGDKAPQFLPKIDALAPLAHCSADLPPIVSICGAPPYEWKCRAEENKLLIASCTALGHPWTRYVELPLCDHGRAYNGAIPYVELFILGRLP